jgi:hypothetical protein
MPGTMDTAEDLAILFNAVTDNPASAVRTLGCQGMNRALEAIEHVRASSEGYLEGFVVIVSANFTEGHRTDESQGVRVPPVVRS